MHKIFDNKIRECYIHKARSINLIEKEKLLWVIQKNIGVVEKLAQKKEELVKETKENKLLSGKD